MTQEHGEQIQAQTELSEEQLDRVAAGIGGKDPWPDPRPNAGGATEPPMAR